MRRLTPLLVLTLAFLALYEPAQAGQGADIHLSTLVEVKVMAGRVGRPSDRLPTTVFGLLNSIDGSTRFQTHSEMERRLTSIEYKLSVLCGTRC